jgi:hypothetical protein
MRKYYPGITLFKLGGSLLVLVAHIMLIRYMTLLPGQALVQFASLATRVVVPCFYVIAGFLAYKGWSHAASSRSYMQKYLKRLLIIYCFFCSFFVAEHIVPKLISDGFTAGNLLVQAKILVIAVFLNGPFIQFWFIPPLIFGLLAAYWFFEKQHVRLAVVLALAGFVAIQFVSGSLMKVFGVTAASFSLINPDYMEYLNLLVTRYIGFGFTFVAAGVFLAKYEAQFMQIRIRPILIFAIVFTVIETALLLQLSDWTTDYKFAFSMLPNTLLIFYGILRIKSPAVQTYHKKINLFSIVTFFGHVLFMRLNLLLMGWDTASMNVGQDFIFLFMTLIECVAVTAFFSLGSKSLAAKQARDLPS